MKALTYVEIDAIYFDNSDADGVSQAAWLDMFDDGGSAVDRGVIILRSSDLSALLVARVTGSVVAGARYRKLTIAVLSALAAEAFKPGVTVGVVFSRAGADAVQPDYAFTFDNATGMADPGTGRFRLNNAALAASPLRLSMISVRAPETLMFRRPCSHGTTAPTPRTAAPC